jgi:hypothetical protein
MSDGGFGGGGWKEWILPASPRSPTPSSGGEAPNWPACSNRELDEVSTKQAVLTHYRYVCARLKLLGTGRLELSLGRKYYL